MCMDDNNCNSIVEVTKEHISNYQFNVTMDVTFWRMRCSLRLTPNYVPKEHISGSTQV